MPSPPIRLPSGVRDFLPRAAARRRALAGRVLDVFESWGYARIVTPVFEVADVTRTGEPEAGATRRIMLYAVCPPILIAAPIGRGTAVGSTCN